MQNQAPGAIHSLRVRGYRRQIVAAVSSAVAVATAACGGRSEQAGAAGTTPKAPVKLQVIYSHQPGHLQHDGFKTILDDFQAHHPGRLAVDEFDTGGVLGAGPQTPKVKAMLAANTPPGIWWSTQSQAADLYGLDALVDLNVQLKANKDWAKGEIAAGALDGATWKGHLAMMPVLAPLQLIGFNKHTLQGAGVPLPPPGFTWNDFVEIGKKTAQPPDRVLFGFPTGGPATDPSGDLLWWMLANGQRPLNADHTKLLFDATPTRETLEWLNDQMARTLLARNGLVNGAVNFDKGDTVTETINANAVTGPRFPNVDPGDGSGIHTLPYPVGPSNTKKEIITYGNTWGPLVFKLPASDAIAVAADVVAWGSRSDVQAKVAAVSLTPTSNTVAGKEENLPPKVRANPILKAINDGAKFMYPTPNIPSWTQAAMILGDQITRVAKGQVQPKDALAAAQPQLQALLDADLKRG